MRRVWIAGALVGVALIGTLPARRAPDAPPAADAARAEPDGRTAAAHREASAAALASAPSAPASASIATSTPAAVAPVEPPIAALVVAAGPTPKAPPDARVPPIDPPPADAPERAQPWEVADPALYRARERRLARQVDDRFLQAAAARLPQLRAAVDEMRARGASQADIDRAEDKIRHLQAVQDALLRGEPLAASAPIAPASGPP